MNRLKSIERGQKKEKKRKKLTGFFGYLGSGSKTVPSTPRSTSGGSITKSSLQLLAFVFVSCTSALVMF